MKFPDQEERKKVMQELKEAIEKEFGFDVHIVGVDKEEK